MDSEEQDRQIERKQHRGWVAQIEKEYASLKTDEAVPHNKDLHRSILANWKAHSPKMWANLIKDGPDFPDKLAYVLQERMWSQYDSLLKSGLNTTDARRLAEEDNLMLEPEVNPNEITLGREPINLPAHGLPESAMPR
jgi:hypothetical protein